MKKEVKKEEPKKVVKGIELVSTKTIDDDHVENTYSDGSTKVIFT